MAKLIILHLLILSIPFVFTGLFYILSGRVNDLKKIPKVYGYKLLILGLSISILIFYLNPILSGVSRDNNYTPPYLEDGKIISGNVNEN
ncbi:MAG: hypothetical protein CML86_03005 [Rhodobiaceae bacterium]|nr:hypothetical protein [Rhodobiaceae bacterium]